MCVCMHACACVCMCLYPEIDIGLLKISREFMLNNIILASARCAGPKKMFMCQ